MPAAERVPSLAARCRRCAHPGQTSSRPWASQPRQSPHGMRPSGCASTEGRCARAAPPLHIPHSRPLAATVHSHNAGVHPSSPAVQPLRWGSVRLARASLAADTPTQRAFFACRSTGWNRGPFRRPRPMPMPSTASHKASVCAHRGTDLPSNAAASACAPIFSRGRTRAAAPNALEPSAPRANASTARAGAGRARNDLPPGHARRLRGARPAAAATSGPPIMFAASIGHPPHVAASRLPVPRARRVARCPKS